MNLNLKFISDIDVSPNIKNAMDTLHRHYLIPLYNRHNKHGETMEYSNTCIRNALNAQNKLNENLEKINKKSFKPIGMTLHEGKTIKLLSGHKTHNSSHGRDITGDYHTLLKSTITEGTKTFYIAYETTQREEHDCYIADTDENLNKMLKKTYGTPIIQNMDLDTNYGVYLGDSTKGTGLFRNMRKIRCSGNRIHFY